MEIKTNFNKGDIVYFLDNDFSALKNKKLEFGEIYIAKGKITHITVIVNNHENDIFYTIQTAVDTFKKINEHYLVLDTKDFAVMIERLFVKPMYNIIINP